MLHCIPVRTQAYFTTPALQHHLGFQAGLWQRIPSLDLPRRYTISAGLLEMPVVQLSACHSAHPLLQCPLHPCQAGLALRYAGGSNLWLGAGGHLPGQRTMVVSAPREHSMSKIGGQQQGQWLLAIKNSPGLTVTANCETRT